jgi:hypothetical protein
MRGAAQTSACLIVQLVLGSWLFCCFVIFRGYVRVTQKSVNWKKKEPKYASKF